MRPRNAPLSLPRLAEIAHPHETALTTRLLATAERNVSQTRRVAVVTRRVVYGGAIGYGVLFAAAVTVHYLAFQEARLDLGNMVQAIWSTAHGHPLQVNTPTGNVMSRLGGHVDPFLVLLVPLWWIWSSPVMLLILQALAVASGALPVYWLARKHLVSERAAAHFAFAYLLFPATQYNAYTLSTGFHAVSLATPLLLFAIWFLDENRLVPFAILALLAGSTKEEIPLAVGCLGIWYAARKGRRLAGAVILACGTAAFLVNFLVIIPHYSPSGSSPFAGRYDSVGGTPHGMVHTLLHDPVAFAQAAATWHKLVFIALLLVPLLGLWLREPLLFLGAVPDLAIDLLSSKPEQTTIQFHYTAGIIPFLVTASILGMAKLKRDRDQWSFYALAGAACFALYSPIYFGAHDARVVLTSDPARAAKAHAISLVPPGAPVSASNRLAGYLSARAQISIFPYVRHTNWVLVDRNDDTIADQRGYRRAIQSLEKSPRWRPVYVSRGIEVYRRSGD